MAEKPTFAQLVSLACHDLRTPLATASGFAHTLQRLESLEAPADRYVEMIGAASAQLGKLLDLLAAAARIEGGRFEPQLREVDSRELADGAARAAESATASGDGAPVSADPAWATTALTALTECVRRHGALQEVSLVADGPTISIGPLMPDVAEIARGDELRDFAAAVATRVLSASGAEVAADGDALRVRLPSDGNVAAAARLP